MKKISKELLNTGVTSKSSIIHMQKLKWKQRPLKSRILLNVKQNFRLLTSPIRIFPDFIIVGAQRCGTTSLSQYLSAHPYVMFSSRKEISFFDKNFLKGYLWYKSHFPVFLYPLFCKLKSDKMIRVGEATPEYLFYPHALKRIKKMNPKIKLIIMLRNPVERAISHYYHSVRYGIETLSFEQAIRIEKQRAFGELKKIIDDENYNSFVLEKTSYLARGVYIEQIKNLFDIYRKDQVLIINSKRLFLKPKESFKEILTFLDLPEWYPIEFKNYGKASYEKISPEIINSLYKFFKPNNQKLYDYLGMDFEWES